MDNPVPTLTQMELVLRHLAQHIETQNSILLDIKDTLARLIASVDTLQTAVDNGADMLGSMMEHQSGSLHRLGQEGIDELRKSASHIAGRVEELTTVVSKLSHQLP